MRITRIKVKNLFGIFNHDILMRMNERITIVHGPNGFGKTVILKMLNSLFNEKYQDFYSIPFSELSIAFDDDSTLVIKKNEGKTGELPELTITLSPPSGNKKTLKLQPLSRGDLGFPLGIIEHEIPELERIGQSMWLHTRTREHLGLNDVIYRYADHLPIPDNKRNINRKLLRELRKSVHIRLIETQRLLTFVSARHPRDYEEKSSMIPSVMRYSEELTQAIQSKLAEYATLSQSLDRTFPTRLVKGGGKHDLTLINLRARLSELEEKRSRLMAAGLLDKEGEIDFKDLQRIDEKNRNVLSVYVDDVQNKLSVFDELTNKIDLLVKIINNRFLYKQISISKKDGFIFTTFDNKILPPSSLSSGEQHELVLLYDLLFKVQPNSLILIDEPELSLHVAWQQQFIKDLQEITSLGGFDVLIATHSPQIIHDRWDLTVELEGPKDADTPNS